MRSINMDLQRMGGKYAEYGFGFAVTVPSDSNNANNHLTHVYPTPKSKKKMLFTLRPENWEERYALVSATDLNMVVGNEFPGATRMERPVTLSDTLKKICSYSRMSNLGEWMDLSSALDDKEVCVRFQTTFLPFSKTKKHKTVEFAMEAHSNFSAATRDDDRHSSNLMFLCTNQGTSVTINRRKRDKSKLFYHTRHVKDKESYFKRRWLEAEWSDCAGKRQNVDNNTCACNWVSEISLCFNTVVVIQVPISENTAIETEKDPSVHDDEYENEQKRQPVELSSSTDGEDDSLSEESENGWSSGEEDTYTDNSIDDDSEIWSEFDHQHTAQLEGGPGNQNEATTSPGTAMNLHTMVTSGMISSTDDMVNDNHNDLSNSQSKLPEGSDICSIIPLQPLTPDTSHEDGLSCGESSNASVEEGVVKTAEHNENSSDDEESVLVFGVTPKQKPTKTKKGLSRVGSKILSFQSLSRKLTPSTKEQKVVEGAEHAHGSDAMTEQQESGDVVKLLNFCPEKLETGQLRKGKLQLARVNVGSSKGRWHQPSQNKAGARHESRINVTITIIHSVVGGVPNKHGVKAAVDEMEALYSLSRDSTPLQ
jgi:hypothetical protein